MLISEKLFEEICDTLGRIKLELLRKENMHLIDLNEKVFQLENVCSFIQTKRALNNKIDNAIAGCNQALINQLLEVKKQAENNLSQQERELL